jgi:uncharacterized lipoprotein YehR (DUF1307 family)
MRPYTFALALCALLSGCGGSSESHTYREGLNTVTETTTRGPFGTTKCTTTITYGGSVFHYCE